jgi:hypothetical protein
MTVLRSVVGIQKTFIDTSVSAIPVRGTAADIAIAQWLIDSLDIPTGPNTAVPTDRELNVPATAGDSSLIRVFYISPNTPPAGLDGVLTRLQSDPTVPLIASAPRNAP